MGSLKGASSTVCSTRILTVNVGFSTGDEAEDPASEVGEESDASSSSA